MENMEEIVISTTKLSDLVPIIVMSFLISICCIVLVVLWFFIQKQNEKTIEDLEGRIEDLEGEIEKIKTGAENIRYVDKCYIKLLNKRLNRLKTPVCAYKKKKNE